VRAYRLDDISMHNNPTLKQQERDSKLQREIPADL
jgi:hypothetical protein